MITANHNGDTISEHYSHASLIDCLRIHKKICDNDTSFLHCSFEIGFAIAVQRKMITTLTKQFKANNPITNFTISIKASIITSLENLANTYSSLPTHFHPAYSAAASIWRDVIEKSEILVMKEAPEIVTTLNKIISLYQADLNATRYFEGMKIMYRDEKLSQINKEAMHLAVTLSNELSTLAAPHLVAIKANNTTPQDIFNKVFWNNCFVHFAPGHIQKINLAIEALNKLEDAVRATRPLPNPLINSTLVDNVEVNIVACTSAFEILMQRGYIENIVTIKPYAFETSSFKCTKNQITPIFERLLNANRMNPTSSFYNDTTAVPLRKSFMEELTKCLGISEQAIFYISREQQEDLSKSKYTVSYNTTIGENPELIHKTWMALESINKAPDQGTLVQATNLQNQRLFVMREYFYQNIDHNHFANNALDIIAALEKLIIIPEYELQRMVDFQKYMLNATRLWLDVVTDLSVYQKKPNTVKPGFLQQFVNIFNNK